MYTQSDYITFEPVNGVENFPTYEEWLEALAEIEKQEQQDNTNNT